MVRMLAPPMDPFRFSAWSAADTLSRNRPPAAVPAAHEPLGRNQPTTAAVVPLGAPVSVSPTCGTAVPPDVNATYSAVRLVNAWLLFLSFASPAAIVGVVLNSFVSAWLRSGVRKTCATP